MAIELYEYVDVKERALQLGCNVPTQLALLPRDFEVAKTKDELVHESSVPAIRVLWQQAGVIETRIEKEGSKPPTLSEKGIEGWIGPVIFVSASLTSQNPYAISVALGVISNYLTDWFKGVPFSERVVKLDIVKETKDRQYMGIHYEGPPQGLEQLPDIITQVSSHE